MRDRLRRPAPRHPRPSAHGGLRLHALLTARPPQPVCRLRHRAPVSARRRQPLAVRWRRLRAPMVLNRPQLPAPRGLRLRACSKPRRHQPPAARHPRPLPAPATPSRSHPARPAPASGGQAPTHPAANSRIAAAAAYRAPPGKRKSKSCCLQNQRVTYVQPSQPRRVHARYTGHVRVCYPRVAL